MERGSGILMHISSLSSPYGIGTFGVQARSFVDFLKDAGQKYWQILPLGPTGFGDSPYQSFSMFAGNPYFIDFDWLIQKGLLRKRAVDSVRWGDNPCAVDYENVYKNRGFVLRQAMRAAPASMLADVEAFRDENRGWVEDYALFMALKRRFDMRSWQDWRDVELRLHEGEAMSHYRKALRADIDYNVFTQYVFWTQWSELRKYANSQGVKIIGDMPIYASMDSCDVWANRRYYELDAAGRPRGVAGVPPDYFSEDGQLWGNPLYNWEAIKADGFGYWTGRMKGAEKAFDLVRLDHFRGLESFWSVPYGEKTARRGEWRAGPGIALLDAVRGNISELEIIAEDLGILTPQVKQLLNKSEFPGMKVLQFAFDNAGENDYLPHNYVRSCVCYTGTHDNTTAAQWAQQIFGEAFEFARAYMGVKERGDLDAALIRSGMASVADLFIAQMQDWLGLSGECRMNTPGRGDGNWSWRLRDGELTSKLAEKICSMTRMYGR